MEDMQLISRYAPVIHFDLNETIPLAAVGCSVFREARRSDSFPKRIVVPPECGLVIEYALYWDYDIQHMYDLEHIWVYVAASGLVVRAEASFHGKFMTLWEPEMTYAHLPEDGHVHAYCQPGKHALLPRGELFRMVPQWKECCMEYAGGGVLVGGPFEGAYQPTQNENDRCRQYIRDTLSFVPELSFDGGTVIPDELMKSWMELKAWIPRRIAALCSELPE